MGQLHQIVTDGTLADLKAALENGADPNAGGHCGATALMVAMDCEDLERAKVLIQHGADPELTDDFNNTSLRHAVSADFAEGVRYLLSLGVDRGYHPRYPLKKVDYSFRAVEVPMPEEMTALMSEAQWQELVESSKSSADEDFENLPIQPMIADVQSIEVLKILVDAGDDVSLAPAEIKRALVGLPVEAKLRVSQEEYQQHKLRCFGSDNPERMDFPFWKDMIRTGVNAYQAKQHFGDDSSFTASAVWCYDRFGSSLTPLSDGRFVQIGGEHEDHYDPDFCIFNDVVVYDGLGGFEIYGYPQNVFPTTDFHTATLTAKGIYIVGCLGYTGQRRLGQTPVFRLELDTWTIEPVETTGELPGWIFKHRANYDANRNVIQISDGEVQVNTKGEDKQIIPNSNRYELDLSSFQWSRLE